MRKIFVLLLTTVFCMAVSAQSRSQHQQRGKRTVAVKGLPQKKHSFYLGLKGGLDLSTMTQPDECKLYDGSGMGFSGGIVGKVRFNRATNNAPAGTGLLGAGLELKYKQNKVKTIATDESGAANADLSIDYFEVPVYVQIYPFFKSDAMNTFYIEAGPDFAGTMSRKPKTLTVENPSPEWSSITYNIDNNGSSLKGMDVRLMAGIGYDFAIKNDKHETTNLIGINARYYMGTSKLAENFNCKMNTLEVSLSWMFNIGNL